MKSTSIIYYLFVRGQRISKSLTAADLLLAICRPLTTSRLGASRTRSAAQPACDRAWQRWRSAWSCCSDRLVNADLLALLMVSAVVQLIVAHIVLILITILNINKVISHNHNSCVMGPRENGERKKHSLYSVIINDFTIAYFLFGYNDLTSLRHSTNMHTKVPL